MPFYINRGKGTEFLGTTRPIDDWADAAGWLEWEVLEYYNTLPPEMREIETAPASVTKAIEAGHATGRVAWREMIRGMFSDGTWFEIERRKIDAEPDAPLLDPGASFRQT